MEGAAWTGEDGRLHADRGMLAALGPVFARLDAKRTPDRSFAEALARMRSIDENVRRLALQYVEGFEAADPASISERSLAEGSGRGRGRDGGETQRIARIESGYDGIVRALAAPLARRIRLEHVVTRVRWRAGDVEVEVEAPNGDPLPAVHARAAIIAVPLGALRAARDARGRVVLDPLPASKARAFRGLETGAAIRVALQLDEPFWLSRAFAKRHGNVNLETMAFLFARAPVPFPTWWTPYPAPAPMLVGWCGGPRAWALSYEPRHVVDTALESAATIFGVARRTLARHVRAAHTHDWSNDPYARGAYTYARVGGSGAGDVLARPVEHTLWFAGEHVAAPGRSGTVDRAIASGRRAAEMVRNRSGTASD